MESGALYRQEYTLDIDTDHCRDSKSIVITQKLIAHVAIFHFRKGGGGTVPAIFTLYLPLQSNQTFTFTQGLPKGCHRHDCEFFVGIRLNNGDRNLLDFVLEGQTSGWVALGFSKTASMVCFITGDFISYVTH